MSLELEEQLAQLGGDWWDLCGVDCMIEEFNCPITKMPMLDPVKAEDGHSYERKPLQQWFKEQEKRGFDVISPMTGLPMGKSTTDNPALRRALQEFVDKFTLLKAKMKEQGGEKIKDAELEVTLAQYSDRPIKLAPWMRAIGMQEHAEGADIIRQTDLGELREAFQKLDGLRKVLKETLDGWTPPSITVVGQKSSGKSTILERVSRQTLFPRDPSTCTKLRKYHR